MHYANAPSLGTGNVPAMTFGKGGGAALWARWLGLFFYCVDAYINRSFYGLGGGGLKEFYSVFGGLKRSWK